MAIRRGPGYKHLSYYEGMHTKTLQYSNYQLDFEREGGRSLSRRKGVTNALSLAEMACNFSNTFAGMNSSSSIEGIFYSTFIKK